VKTGVQIIYNDSKTLVSGFRRNDGKANFHTFYENILIKYFNIDGFVKVFFCFIFVIPAKARIHPAESGAAFAGVTGFLTSYDFINIILQLNPDYHFPNIKFGINNVSSGKIIQIAIQIMEAIKNDNDSLT
jgi:hypothetical protein